jgi:hypothetical protein
MSLELNSQAETILRQEAEREGVSINDLILRTFSKPRRKLGAVARFAPRLRVLPPEEARRQNAASIAYTQAQLAEAEQAAPEEIAEAETEWQTFQHAMNASRRASGERLLYKEDSPW